MDGRRLEIKDATLSDVGSYLCIAENVMGATTALTEIILGGLFVCLFVCFFS